MTNQRCSFMACLLVLALASPALAGGKGKGKEASVNVTITQQKVTAKATDKNKEAAVQVKVVISSGERDVIRSYIHSCTVPDKPGAKAKGLPPGLAKKVERGGQLPPGWQKKCVRGEILPSDVFKLCHPLPKELVVKLPPAPPDTIIVAIDGRIVRLAKATHEILDVFDVP